MCKHAGRLDGISFDISRSTQRLDALADMHSPHTALLAPEIPVTDSVIPSVRSQVYCWQPGQLSRPLSVYKTCHRFHSAAFSVCGELSVFRCCMRQLLAGPLQACLAYSLTSRMSMKARATHTGLWRRRDRSAPSLPFWLRRSPRWTFERFREVTFFRNCLSRISRGHVFWNCLERNFQASL